MKFGMFHNLRLPKPGSPEAAREFLGDFIEQVTYAEEMGFEGMWVTEHHFELGYLASAPEVLLSSVAQRTSKIRLGFAVVLAPIHHPLHIASKVAMLDLLSNGRVDLCLGRSSTPHQLIPFGVKLEDTRDMMYEAMSMIPRMWTEDLFSHEGKYYNVPPRVVVPKPLQKPHPPLWSACNQEDTARTAGELGLGFMTHARPGIAKTAHLINTYKEAIKGAKPVGKSINYHVEADTFCICDENGERARQKGAEAVAAAAARMSVEQPQYWAGVPEDSIPAEYRHHYRRVKNDPIHQRGPTTVTPDSLLETGGYCMGDPDFCIKFVEQYEALGVEEYVLSLQSGTLTHQDGMNTIRLFGKYVIPYFQEKEKKAHAAAQRVSARR